jgi:hypothetical protein
VATCLTDLPDRPHRTLLLLTDGLAGDQQDIVRGAYDVAGSTVPLVGVAIGSDAPLGIGVQHGWRRVGDPVLVTRSMGNRVHSIDDRPALDVSTSR